VRATQSTLGQLILRASIVLEPLNRVNWYFSIS
jgi:hypothetical protein